MILEKARNVETVKTRRLPGAEWGKRRRRSRVRLLCVWPQAGYRVLHVCSNPQNAQHKEEP